MNEEQLKKAFTDLLAQIEQRVPELVTSHLASLEKAKQEKVDEEAKKKAAADEEAKKKAAETAAKKQASEETQAKLAKALEEQTALTQQLEESRKRVAELEKRSKVETVQKASDEREDWDKEAEAIMAFVPDYAQPNKK